MLEEEPEVATDRKEVSGMLKCKDCPLSFSFQLEKMARMSDRGD